MNKILKIISIISIAFLGSSGFTQSAQAIETAGLMVWICPTANSDTTDCQLLDNDNHPSLFDESDFLPGKSVSRWVKVANMSGEDQEIGLKMTGSCSGCLYSNNLLSDVLELTIKQDGEELQKRPLSNFYATGKEWYLSSLNNGAMNTYEFSVLFEPESGNNYQGCQTSFDFDIGFWGESAGGEITPPGGGGGSGGGGGKIIAGLIIKNESVSPTNNSATIAWTTSKPATSRVIYASQSESHNFDWKNPPNYGYPHSTLENSGKTSEHSMDISPLTSGITYYFRCISHASPDTISSEHSFTTLGVKEGVGKKEEKREEKPTKETGVPERIKEIPKKITKKIKKITEEIIPSVLGTETEKSVPKEKTGSPGNVAAPGERAPQRGLAPSTSTGMIWEEINKYASLIILVILCLLALILIGAREWKLFREKRKK